MRKRVFVSFDFPYDKNLKDLIVAQSHLPGRGRRRHPFQIADLSLKEKSKNKTWPRKARERIKEAGMVMVMLGSETHRARGVKKEIAMARKLHKPIIQVVAKNKRRVKPLPNAGAVVPWKWDAIRKALNKTYFDVDSAA